MTPGHQTDLEAGLESESETRRRSQKHGSSQARLLEKISGGTGAKFRAAATNGPY